MAVGFLCKRGLAEEERNGSTVVRLTEEGERARRAYRHRLAELEDDWCTRFGHQVRELRDALAPLADLAFPTLHADGWRATVRTPDTLPHHPVVSHGGGFPDGS